MPGKYDPPKAHRFKKGVSGNPLGAKLHNPELRAIKRLTAAEVAEIGALVVSKNLVALKAVIENPNASALKVWMATIAFRGIKSGNAKSLDILLNRLIGRTTEKIQISGSDGGPIRSIVGAMTKEERAEELARIRKARKEAGED